MAELTSGMALSAAPGSVRLRVTLAAGSRDGASGAPEGEPAGMIVEAWEGRAPIVDGEPEAVTLAWIDPPRARLATPNGSHDALVLPRLDRKVRATGVARVEVVVDGWRFEVELEPETRARLRERATRQGGDRAKGGPVELHAIIPGRVVSVDVAEGDRVEAGQRVLVIEAMKMQNELRAPRDGTVGRVAVGSGQTVEQGDLLLVVA
jgi:biotin carboxyl carrier protein